MKNITYDAITGIITIEEAEDVIAMSEIKNDALTTEDRLNTLENTMGEILENIIPVLIGG
jgi:hypothetical protein